MSGKMDAVIKTIERNVKLIRANWTAENLCVSRRASELLNRTVCDPGLAEASVGVSPIWKLCVKVRALGVG